MSIIPSLAQRLGWIVEPLRAVLAAHASKHRAAAPVVLVLHGYLARLLRRFASLTDRLDKYRPAHSAKPRDRLPPAAPRKLRPPQTYASLCRMTPDVNAYGSQLRYLMCSAEMKQLLAASPRAARMLRPLCRMLGIGPPDADLPPALFPPRQAAGGRTVHPHPPRTKPAAPVASLPDRLAPAC